MTSWSSELANLSPEARCRVIAKVRRALREERWWQGQVDEMESIAHLGGYAKGLSEGGRLEFWLGITLGGMVGSGLVVVFQTIFQ